MKVIKTANILLFTILFSFIGFVLVQLTGRGADVISELYYSEIYNIEIYSTMMPSYIAYGFSELLLIFVSLFMFFKIRHKAIMSVKMQYLMIFVISILLEMSMAFLMFIFDGLMLLYGLFLTKLFTIPLSFVISWFIIKVKKERYDAINANVSI